MPCYDPPRPEDIEAGKRAGRHMHAMTALLCAITQGAAEPIVQELAAAWCKHHRIVDQKLAAVKYEWQDKTIEVEAEKCRRILDIVYLKLCTPVDSPE